MGKSQSQPFTQGQETREGLPRAAAQGAPSRSGPEPGASLRLSPDVGQCVISSKRCTGIRGAGNSKAGETRAKLERPLPGVRHSPKTSSSALFFPRLLTEKNALLSRPLLPPLQLSYKSGLCFPAPKGYRVARRGAKCQLDKFRKRVKKYSDQIPQQQP